MSKCTVQIGVQSVPYIVYTYILELPRLRSMLITRLLIMMVIITQCNTIPASAKFEVFLLSTEITSDRDVLVQNIGDEFFVLNRTPLMVTDTLPEPIAQFGMWNVSKSLRYTLTIPSKTVERSYFVNFQVKADTVVVHDLNKILIFIKSAEKVFRFSRSIELNAGFVRSHFLSDSVILFNDQHVSWKPRQSRMYRSSLSSQSWQQGEMCDYHDPQCADLTFVQPRQLVDVGGRLSVRSEVCSYGFWVENRISGQIWKIDEEPASWIRRDSVPVPIDNLNRPQSAFPRLTRFVRYNSVISAVAVVNDTLLCISWTTPPNDTGAIGHFNCDFWALKNDTWVLVQRRTDPMRIDKEYSISDVWHRTLGRHVARWRFDLVPYPETRLSNIHWGSKQEYDDRCEVFFALHDLQYVLVVTDLEKGIP